MELSDIALYAGEIIGTAFAAFFAYIFVRLSRLRERVGTTVVKQNDQSARQSELSEALEIIENRLEAAEIALRDSDKKREQSEKRREEIVSQMSQLQMEYALHKVNTQTMIDEAVSDAVEPLQRQINNLRNELRMSNETVRRAEASNRKLRLKNEALENTIDDLESLAAKHAYEAGRLQRYAQFWWWMYMEASYLLRLEQESGPWRHYPRLPAAV